MTLVLEGFLRERLPHGTKEGSRYRVGNLQGDAGGSLSIDLKNGCFCDFADDSIRGGLFDLISLIVYGRKDRILGKMYADYYTGGGYTGEVKGVAPRKEITTAQTSPVIACDAVNRIWRKSSEINPFCAAYKYLLSRGLNSTYSWLRCANLKHKSGDIYPALVAGVSGEAGQLQAIHRIFLTNNGDKAPVKLNKMALGTVAGGAVRLVEPKTVLGIAEGVETAIAAHILTKVPTWSAIAGGNMGNIAIPSHIKSIVIMGDNDKPGIKYSEKAAEIYKKQGFKVCIAYPYKKDFNEDLQAHL